MHRFQQLAGTGAAALLALAFAIPAGAGMSDPTPPPTTAPPTAPPSLCPSTEELVLNVAEACLPPFGPGSNQALAIRNSRRGSLNWEWNGGEGGLTADEDIFFDPTGDTDYLFCLYDNVQLPDQNNVKAQKIDVMPAGQAMLIDERLIPAGDGWRETRNGFIYTGGRNGEASLLTLRQFGDRLKLKLTARNDLPPVPLADPETDGFAVALLLNSEGGCFATLHVDPTTNNRRSYSSSEAGFLELPEPTPQPTWMPRPTAPPSTPPPATVMPQPTDAPEN